MFIYYIGKDSLGKIPWLGWILIKECLIPIKRSNLKSAIDTLSETSNYS